MSKNQSNIAFSASILSTDFSELPKTLKSLKNKVARVHLDVMDGNFVPNLTFGAKMVADLRSHTNLPFDVHLMINHPDRYLQDYIDAGADIIIPHIEASNEMQIINMAKTVRNAGKKFGLAINPSTGFKQLAPYTGMIDKILIMTVNPGFAGQDFITDTMPKIREICTYIASKELNIEIAVDGGINAETISHFKDIGINEAILGSYLYSKATIDEALVLAQEALII